MPRIRIQWATNPPQNWQVIEAQAWKNLAKKQEPDGSQAIDGAAGWVMAVEVDGVVFQGFDHYAADFVGGGFLRVAAWFDDVEDFDHPLSDGYRWGGQWVFRPHRFDPAVGQVNTHQTCTLYSENMPATLRINPPGTSMSGGIVSVRPWSEFAPPPADVIRHGVWLPDDLYAAHLSGRSAVSWEGWT